MTAGRGHIGVVIVHFGDAAPTLRCLRSVAEDPSRVRRSIVVVDNSPAADERLGRTGASVLRCPDNPGFGGGANRGVGQLDPGGSRDGPLTAYAILNHDVELLPGYLDAAVTSLADPTVGAVAGPLYRDRPDGGLWYAGGEFRFLTGTVWHSESESDAEREREVSFLPGASLAVAAQAWHDVGGFDPGIFLYHEDVDLCLRLRRAGWRLRFAPAMRAVHHVGSATGSGNLSPFFLEHLIATRLRPHRSLPYRVYLALLHTPHELLRALRILLRDGRAGAPRARAVLRGQRRALRDVLRRR